MILVVILSPTSGPAKVGQAEAATFIDTAVTTHTSYREKQLPLKIRSSSQKVVTAPLDGHTAPNRQARGFLMRLVLRSDRGLESKTRECVKVPFFPACSVGWDDSPRFEEFASIAINRSPDQFERLVRAARHFVASDTDSKFIYIAAWNEWTEDHVLLPDSYWEYSYLEALQRAVKD